MFHFIMLISTVTVDFDIDGLFGTFLYLAVISSPNKNLAFKLIIDFSKNRHTGVFDYADHEFGLGFLIRGTEPPRSQKF